MEKLNFIWESYCWQKHEGKYQKTFASGDNTKYSLEDAQQKCVEYGDACNGIACERNGVSQCTVRQTNALFNGNADAYVKIEDCPGITNRCKIQE